MRGSDAASESAFFQTYGGIFGLQVADRALREDEHDRAAAAAAQAERVRELLARIEEGGFPAAVARTAHLLARLGQPIRLEAVEAKRDLMRDYADLLPDLPRDVARRIRGEQEVIVAHAPQRAIETLPALLADPAERERFFALFEKLLADPRVHDAHPTDAQRAMFERLRLVLAPAILATRRTRASASRAAAGARATTRGTVRPRIRRAKGG